MRWIVGLDLRPRSRGAVHFASWLAAEIALPEVESLVGVHVLEAEHLRAALQTQHLDEVETAARAEARRTLDREDPERRVGEVKIVEALSADEGLRVARRERQADGTIIGRRARREEQRLVRLGRVARHLLRQPDGPLVVVPPDLEREGIGDGPIVALTSLEPDAEACCALAASLAARTGRPLDVVHVVPHLAASSPEFVPVAHLAERTDALVRQGQADLETWLRARHLRPSRTHVLPGTLIDTAILHAERVRAPLLAIGVRRREGLERIFSPSLASELAATATVPVLVVPAA